MCIPGTALEVFPVRKAVLVTEVIEMNETTKHLVSGLCMAIALLGILVGGASAALCPEGYMGEVIGTDAKNNTFEVQTTHEWSYNGSNHEWQPNVTIMEWLFPNEDAMNEICVGDYVEILGFAASPGWVIGLGKMKSSTEKIITDMYGDPDLLEPYFHDAQNPPLLGGYTLEYDSKPNCSDCGACNCVADYTNVTIVNKTGHIVVDSHRLYPGRNCTHSGAEYRINITFHSGEAPAHPECTDQPGFGPQPISDFTVHIIRVPATENQPPVANFTYSPEYPVAGEMVAFDASGSTDPDGNITGYRWDFDDGNITTTSEKITMHPYTSKGDYNVNLTVVDNKDAEHSANHTVAVTARGDLNHDGNITIADVVIVLGIAVRGEYTPEADMDENGYVNALDARMVMYVATT
jgi:PKD repeat protein